jgi:hypothetical protein
LTQLHDVGAKRSIRRLGAAAWLERVYLALRDGDIDRARRALAARQRLRSLAEFWRLQALCKRDRGSADLRVSAPARTWPVR